MDQQYFSILNPLLMFGRILGFPLPDKYGKAPKNRILRKLLNCYSFLMTTASFVSLVTIGFRWKSKSPNDNSKLDDVWRITYFAGIFWIYGYILIQRNSLKKVLENWFKCTSCSMDNLKSTSHRSYFTFVCASIVLLISTQVLETIFFDLDVNKQKIENFERATFFEKYFDVTTCSLEKVKHVEIFQHPLVLFIIYMISKLSTLGTDYGDVLCIVLSFGLTSKLQSVNEYLRAQLQSCHTHMIKYSLYGEVKAYKKNWGKVPWQAIYTDLVNLRKLADETSKFTSPLFLSSLCVDVLSSVLNLDQSINPNSVFRRNLRSYIIISLLHYGMRLVFVIHFASGVDRASDQILDTIENAPESAQSWPMERILVMLRRKPVAITFYDTFVIRRNLFLSIISFVFTIEIMILQASPKNNNSL